MTHRATLRLSDRLSVEVTITGPGLDGTWVAAADGHPHDYRSGDTAFKALEALQDHLREALLS